MLVSSPYEVVLIEITRVLIKKIEISDLYRSNILNYMWLKYNDLWWRVWLEEEIYKLLNITLF